MKIITVSHVGFPLAGADSHLSFKNKMHTGEKKINRIDVVLSEAWNCLQPTKALSFRGLVHSVKNGPDVILRIHPKYSDIPLYDFSSPEVIINAAIFRYPCRNTTIFGGHQCDKWQLCKF